MTESIEFTKIKHDVNGNPRYVCHYHNLLTKKELNRKLYDEEGRMVFPSKYEIAVKRANKIGGRKYHTKAYGGGIVFQSYNIRELEKYIKQTVEKAQSHEI